jgi:hypothetical protein
MPVMPDSPLSDVAPPSRKRKRNPWPKVYPQFTLTPDEHGARQGAVLAKRVVGKSIPTISKEMNMSTLQVRKELGEAQRKGLHSKAVDFITEELMPKALAVYAVALENGDTEIATKVLEGLGILGKNGQVGILMSSADGSDMSFEKWRLSVTKQVQNGQQAGSASGVAEGVAEGGPRGSALDGEIIAEGVGEADGERDVEGGAA